jgi:uncharacterized protein (DUF2126 family)
MSLAQQLLLRALVARFWREPYAPPKLARWGTELHDRFLLPHVIEQDFADVIVDLNAAGYPLRAEWFAAHLGSVSQGRRLRRQRHCWNCARHWNRGMCWARRARSAARCATWIRPGAPAGQTQRVAAAALSADLQRHPGAAAAHRARRRVCRRRAFRAWQPANCLQPTIPVHAPLVFDLLDTWMGRSLGGCQYHVAHPGGRNYDSLPVNANEAESRRMARFFRIGHTPGNFLCRFWKLTTNCR